MKKGRKEITIMMMNKTNKNERRSSEEILNLLEALQPNLKSPRLAVRKR